MNNPPRTLRRDTRFFISAVTRELGTVRKLVKKALEDNDYHAVEQDNFPPDYRDLVAKLRERINSCDAVIHIAGHAYGAEPKQKPPEQPRRSYTQLEYDIARELKKPVYVFLTGASFPADQYAPEPPELQELQAAHRQSLTTTGHDYNPTTTPEQLDQKVRSLKLKVEKLEGELQQVDEKLAHTGRRLGRWVMVGIAVGLLILGSVGYLTWRQQVEHRRQEAEILAQQQEREKQERERIAAEAERQRSQTLKDLQKEIAEGLLQELIADKTITADEARERALKRLATVKLPLAEIKALIDAKIPPAVVASQTPLDRAYAALSQKNYAEVRRIADQEKKQGYQLAILDGTAALAQFRKEPKPEYNQAALAAFRRAMALADPNSATEWESWTEAAASVGTVLHSLARYSEAEPLLRDCWRIREAKIGPNSSKLATVLNNLAAVLRATNRLTEAELLYRRALAIDEASLGPNHPDVAGRLNNLAELLRTTNRLTEAEPIYRRALAIDEASYGPDHPRVSIDLNNLAALLQDTNRLTEAEPLYRRALAIDEASFGPNHSQVAIRLNNLATLLQATNRLMEAEPIYRRSLAIDEVSLGPNHPDVAIALNNLAELLRARNRLTEAEPIYRRALAIDEASLGPNHPGVARDLNNLALLLQAKNRLTEAEPLYRRALAIDEASYGPDHPDVASRLNNLARLLQATNRLAEAEPLMRRSMIIFVRSLGQNHPNSGVVTYNYILLLLDLKIDKLEIAVRIKSACESTEKLTPIVPEVDRLLGPAKSTKEVLEALDRQYRKEGKPPVWFLPLKEPISPHLDELLGKNK